MVEPNRRATSTAVAVTLSSWARVQGSWTTGDCSTPTGSTFSQPITLNIYGPSTDSGLTHGALIASSTQTFAIPYRPSASTKCTDGSDQVVYGIVYNTRDFGPNPTGVSGPSDSLHIALSSDGDVSAGSSVSGTVWQNSANGGVYCDSGAAGTGTFRADSDCWAPYVPAVQFQGKQLRLMQPLD
jgi:hypothetical protein